jgi:hypothetical protein
MGKRKAPDQDPGLFILKTLTVPGSRLELPTSGL